MVGSAQENLGPGFALAQFEADGDPDLSFDGNGLGTRDFSGTVDGLYGVTVQGDGRIVTGGNLGDDFAVARWNVNGSNDNTFDENGYITRTFETPFDQAWNDIALHPDGTIVTAGLTNVGHGADLADRALLLQWTGRPPVRPLLRRPAHRLRRLRQRGGHGDRQQRQDRGCRKRRPGLRRRRYVTTGPTVNCAEPKKGAKECKKKKKKGKKGAAAAEKKKKKKCKKKKKKKK